MNEVEYQRPHIAHRKPVFSGRVFLFHRTQTFEYPFPGTLGRNSFSLGTCATKQRFNQAKLFNPFSFIHGCDR
ncbi:MAG: hypothetical protein JXR76_15245 [Deltaproteobacteria bacterium]|nr:hypothetical protein [Deltaproteobacteria bacterium]